MNCKYEKSGETGLLIFDGELNAHCSDALMEVLMLSVADSEHLVVDLEKVTVLDPLCFKIFGIACKTAARLKKRLTLTGNKAVELRQSFGTYAVSAEHELVPAYNGGH